MPRDQREPQSYGSQADWTTGKTGEQVNRQKSAPPPEHRDFYDDRRESEESDPAQGGLVSEFQLAENVQPRGLEIPDPASPPRVTTEAGGAKRDSYFRRRDWE